MTKTKWVKSSVRRDTMAMLKTGKTKDYVIENLITRIEQLQDDFKIVVAMVKEPLIKVPVNKELTFANPYCINGSAHSWNLLTRSQPADCVISFYECNNKCCAYEYRHL